jgi:hypothetical protein
MMRNIQTDYRWEEFSTRLESCNIAIPEEYKSGIAATRGYRRDTRNSDRNIPRIAVHSACRDFSS